MTQDNAAARAAEGKLASPGIHIPPPFFYIGAFAVGYGLDRVWPMSLLPPSLQAVGVIGGWICIALGAGLAFWGLATFGIAGTSPMPHSPAKQLVIRGPYRFTRNPMYVGMTLLYLGGTLLTRILWVLPLLPLALVAIRFYVIAREERYLTDEFGQAYVDYMSRVRRWL